jgi:sporulation protein YlmC with PRC-barrel domain
MLKVKNISEVLGKKAYTSEGDFFGQIDEVNLVDNRIEGWKIRVGAGFTSALGGARGVIIPHQFVKAVGDVFIITKSMIPARSEDSLDLDSGAEAQNSSEEDIL